MLVLGLQGSPRKKGNTDYLLSLFLDEAKKLGAKTHAAYVPSLNIKPCLGCGHCERKGFCVIQDDAMTSEIYPLLRKADVIVIASPMYFYSAPAQLKALIDRSQALWSRKYIFKLSSPASRNRIGFLLAQGATKGKNLFDGLNLTAKYFFDAVDATHGGSLTYRKIENAGDMEKHPAAPEDIKKEAHRLILPLLSRKKILFACRENACRSQMASAFAQRMAGDTIEALSGGSLPAEAINPLMAEVMAEKGIDMAFRRPQSIDAAVLETKPDMIITMGCGEECPFVPGVQREDWNLPDPAGKPVEFMRNVRDEIEKKVSALALTI